MMGRLLLSCLLALSGTGCNYKVTKVADNVDVPAFSREQLSFALVQRYVFSKSCTVCHGTSGGVSLESYPLVVSRLAEVRRSALETGSMPKAPMDALSPSQRALLQAWIDAGAPELGVGGSPPPPEELKPTFSSIHELVIAKKCRQCHAPTGEAWKVPLDSVADLLNSPDDLVIPGDPDGSYLVVMVSPGARKPMPPSASGMSPLRQEEIDAIREWIRNGAKD